MADIFITKTERIGFSPFVEDLHIPTGDKIDAGAADIFQNDLTAANGGGNFNGIQQTDGLPHQRAGQGTVGFDRQAGVNAAGDADGGGNDPGGVGHLRNAVLLPARAAEAGNLPALSRLLGGEMAALGTDDADKLLFHWTTSSFAMTETVTAPTAFSKMARGSAIFSISPGAMCSRGKRQSRAPASSVTVMTRSR